MNNDKLTDNDRRALAIYNDLRQQNEERMSEVTARPMLAKNDDGGLNFDLSKAERGCEHCNGRGFRSRPVIAAGEIHTQLVICRCVARNGGIRDDAPKAAAYPVQAQQE